MKILIIEDEILVAESLIRLLKKLEPAAVITGPLTSVKATVQWLDSQPEPDLIVSDIQLADGTSIDIFTNYKFTCPIIFTTAYNEYAIRAFKVNSIDYLLKPIDRNELENALSKFHLMKSKFNDVIYLEEMKQLFSNFHNSKQFKERFAVHSGRFVTLIPRYVNMADINCS
ncbi:MAG: response regulator, partial [Ginsengibacter sp.]